MLRFTFAVLALLCLSNGLFGQKRRFLFGTFHEKNTVVNGLSVGGWSRFDIANTTANGIKLEVPGIGIFVPMAPGPFVVESDSLFEALKKEPFSEKINGLAIAATGSVCHCRVNGLTVGGIGHYNAKVNGLSASTVMNQSQMHNGLQAAAHFAMSYQMNGFQGAVFFASAHRMNGFQIAGIRSSCERGRGVQISAKTHSREMRGLQIGLINRRETGKGLQIGIWNISGNRALPFLNWG